MKNIYFYTTTAIIVMVALFLFSCKEKKANHDKRIPVEVYTIKNDSTAEKRNYTGIVEESTASMLSFQVPGNIDFVYVRENQIAIKGQQLASIDKHILQNNYDATMSVLLQAEDAYKRMKLLYENSSLPEIKWIETQTALQQAKTMEAIARENLQNSVLTAPFTGMITSRIAEPGMNVSPGMPLFRITNMDSIKIKVAIPENEIAQMHVMQSCEVQIPALFNNKIFQGHIAEKGIIANPLSHTYEVKIILKGKPKELLPGMICNVDIIKSTLRPRIILPTTAIQLDGTDHFVWGVKDSVATKMKVSTEKLYGEGIMIENGLKEGDMIIINGYHKVSNGTKVEIK